MSDDKLFERVGRVCAAGEVLFRDGEPGDTMYVLRSGRIRVYKEVNGREKTLAHLGAGDFFGEMALLNHKPRTATAEVVEESRLLVIDQKMFEAMVVGNSEIAVRLIQRLAKRLDEANTLIGVLMQRDPKARVILGLARVANQADANRDGEVWVDVNEEILAQQVGVPLENVHAVVTRMSRLGIIQRSAGGFYIPNIMRLHDFLEFLKTREPEGERA